MKKKEVFLTKRLTRDLENLNNLDEERVAGLADAEYRGILQIAKELTEADFSKGRHAREELRKKLISIMEKHEKQHPEPSSEELDLEELDYVAGGSKEDPDCPFQDN